MPDGLRTKHGFRTFQRCLPKSVEFNGIQFVSKAAVEFHVRDILNRHTPMQPLTGDDLRFVVAVLDKHPNREVIVDCGVRRIVVQHLRDKYDSRRFLVIRTDGSVRDFSWRVVLSPKTAHRRLMGACRFAVRPQIRDFRTRAFAGVPSLICEVSGKPITEADSDVDHIPPRTFERLVIAWLSTVGLEPDGVSFVPMVGYEQPDRWEDNFLEENWREYHRTHAHLRVIHPWANRSIVRKADSLCQK